MQSLLLGCFRLALALFWLLVNFIIFFLQLEDPFHFLIFFQKLFSSNSLISIHKIAPHARNPTIFAPLFGFGFANIPLLGVDPWISLLFESNRVSIFLIFFNTSRAACRNFCQLISIFALIYKIPASLLTNFCFFFTDKITVFLQNHKHYWIFLQMLIWSKGQTGCIVVDDCHLEEWEQLFWELL